MVDVVESSSLVVGEVKQCFGCRERMRHSDSGSQSTESSGIHTTTKWVSFLLLLYLTEVTLILLFSIWFFSERKILIFV